MIPVTIELPGSLLLANEGSASRLQQYSRFLLALKFFELGELSSGQAAALCGITRPDFLRDASRMGTAIAHLDDEELDEEVHRAKGR